MWKAAAGQSVSAAVEDGGDDWETDPDFEVASNPNPIYDYTKVPITTPRHLTLDQQSPRAGPNGLCRGRWWFSV